jgi:hypothetical protein
MTATGPEPADAGSPGGCGASPGGCGASPGGCGASPGGWASGGPGGKYLAPRCAAMCKIAMGITMGYMLILLL